MVDRARDPVAWTDVLQIVKTVVAAVGAWLIADQVFALPQPFLAPWAALLVVHATVYRTFWRGAKQVAATVVGVILAWGTGNLLGVDPVALGVMLLAALVVGRARGLRDEATTVVTTALIVLTTGSSDQDHVLLARLFDTAIGVVVGVVVNAMVWPPLRDLTAARAIEDVSGHVGRLLSDMHQGLRDGCAEGQAEDWVRRTQDLDEQVDEAWALVRQARESGRLNPRRGSATVREAAQLAPSLEGIEQSLSEVRSMAQTLAHSATDLNEWDDQFRARWTDLLRVVGEARQEASSGRLAKVPTELADLASDYSDQHLPSLHWPEYGALILSLRNVACSMDLAAAAEPDRGAARVWRDKPGPGHDPAPTSGRSG